MWGKCLKHSKILISWGNKFYWYPHAMILGYFLNLKEISEIGNSIFYFMIITYVLVISIGLLLTIKGLKIYDYVYTEGIYNKTEEWNE